MSKLFRPKKYLKPKNIEEAVSILTKYQEKARIIAGGTDLIVDKPPEVEYLVDIESLPLDYIRKNETGLSIGALTSVSNLRRSDLLKENAFTALSEACQQFGHSNLRNLATIGGNICSAVPSADLPPPLMVLGAKIKKTGPDGEATIPLERFFTFVRNTILRPGDVLTEIQIPDLKKRTGTAFLKIGRTSADIALVNVAASVMLNKDGLFEKVKIALGAVAPTPIRAIESEELLKGKKLDEDLIEVVAKVASKETKPISDVRCSVEYRKAMSAVLVKRALCLAMERAKERE
jgi:carbon-monoxide dehydrogenase medium subunit